MTWVDGGLTLALHTYFQSYERFLNIGLRFLPKVKNVRAPQNGDQSVVSVLSEHAGAAFSPSYLRKASKFFRPSSIPLYALLRSVLETCATPPAPKNRR